MSGDEFREMLSGAERHARHLFQQGCDPNELGKALAMLNQPWETTETVADTLNKVAKNRNLHHSGRTRGYVEAVAAVVSDVARLSGDETRAKLMLGWTFRKLRTQSEFEKSRRTPRGRRR